MLHPRIATAARIRPLPNTSVAAPNTARIKLKIVNVFAIAIERYDRLVAAAGSGPRSRSRRSASVAVKPLLTTTTVSLTRQTRYTPTTTS